MTQEQPTLQTKRLTLRPFASTDGPDVQHLAGDRDVASTTLNIPHPYASDMAEAWIDTHRDGYEEGTLCNFALVRSSDRSLVGAVGLVIRPHDDAAELGYWIGKPYWSQGYATEAAAAVVRHGFEVRGLNRIHARHMASNPASGRVLQKIGMTHEGCQRQQVMKWGVYEDLELYGLLAAEWGPRT